MRTIRLLLCLFTLVLFSCKKDATTTTEPQTTLLVGKKWKLDTYQGWNTDTKDWYAQEKYDGSYIIEFRNDGKILLQDYAFRNYKIIDSVIYTDWVEDGEKHSYDTKIDSLTSQKFSVTGKFFPFVGYLSKHTYTAQ